MPFWTRFFNRRHKEQDFEEEIHAHLAIEVQQRLERGEGAEQARQAALKDFGNIGMVREATREAWGWDTLDRLSQDIRYSLRLVLRQPAITAIIVLSLALGIGANTVSFSLVNAMLLRSLPYPDPNRLMIIWSIAQKQPDKKDLTNPGKCLDLPDRNTVFESVGCYGAVEGTFADESSSKTGPEWISGEVYTFGAAQAIGVKPILGRWFTADEDKPAGNRVALISYGLWQRRFGGAPDVLGKQVRVADAFGGETASTIIGVMPAGFGFASHWDNAPSDYWLPERLSPLARRTPSRNNFVVARLKPGVSREQAQSEMNALSQSFAEETPALDRGWGMRVEPVSDAFSGELRKPFRLLEFAVVCVLFIACANVAGLLLAQGTAQQRELAVRAALGSTRWRILRQLLTQSTLLACLGGLVCLPIAAAGLRVLVTAVRAGTDNSSLPPGIRRLGEANLDTRVLLFTAAVSLLTGLIFGILPASQVSRPDVLESLKEAGRSSTAGYRRAGLRSAFVVSQISIAVILLVGTGLMMTSLLRLRAVNVGFDPKNLMTFSMIFQGQQFHRATGNVTPSGSREIEVNPRMNATTTQLLGLLRNIPGVESATAMASNEPLDAWARSYAFNIDGRPSPTPQQEPFTAEWYPITPDYFHTLHIPVLRGREFLEQDSSANLPVALINATMAQRFWPNEDPIGKQIRVDFYNDKPRQIIGVVGDVLQSSRQSQLQAQLYVPYAQLPLLQEGRTAAGLEYMNFLIRSARDSKELVPLLKEAAAEADPSHAPSAFLALEQNLVDQTQGFRQYVMLLGVFSSIAVALALVGVYGIMSHAVGQQTNEIGIRIALGASWHGIFGLVLRRGMLLLASGLILGVGASLALTRTIRGALWGVTPTDPWTFLLVVLAVSTVGLLACCFPARRALKIDPVATLRHQ